MKIALSAGHFPAAPGAKFGALDEHTAANQWVSHLRRELEDFGFDVFEVPTGKLPLKIAAINAENCDLAVEIHFNSDPARKGRGSETLYMPGSIAGEALALAIQRRLGAVCLPDRGPKEAWYRMDRPGHVDFSGDVDGDEAIDAFVQLTACPAAIVEPLFIHEPGVVPPNGEAVRAIARGIAEMYVA